MKRLLFVASIVITLTFSRQVSATCSANLSASVSGTTLNVNASGGGACGGSELTVNLDGHTIGGQSCGGSSCSLSFAYSVACLNSGPHTVALVVSCGKVVQQQGGGTSCEGDNGNSTQMFTLNVQPSGSISFMPDATGNGNVMVNYSFPGTDSAGQRSVTRTLERNVNGSHTINVDTIHPEQATGVWLVPWSISCYKNGTYNFSAEIKHCSGELADDTTPVTVNNTPTVSVSYDDTAGAIAVDYNFPNTSDAGQRTVYRMIYFPGSYNTDTFHPDQQSGTWRIPFSNACGTSAISIGAEAQSCGESAEAQQIPLPVSNHTPSVSVSVAPSGASYTASVNYSFPGTDSSSQRNLRLEWAPAGTLIAQTQPTDQSGVWQVPVSACAGGQSAQLRAVATACG
ncbi:MAG: hypothetical protein ACREMY_14500, partial [bacterium]